MAVTTTKTDELVAHLRATTAIARVGGPDGLVLPEAIRRAAGVNAGDTVFLEVIDEGEFRVRIRKIDPAQGWFWTPEWLAGERSADDDRSAGRVERFASHEEFKAALKQWSDDADV